MQNILGFLILALLAGTGAVASSILPLGLPGPVIGLTFCFLLMVWVPRSAGLVMPAAETLLKNLGLLITPAAVGLAAFVPGLKLEILPLAVVLITSTIVTGMVTLFVYQGLRQWLAPRP